MVLDPFEYSYGRGIRFVRGDIHGHPQMRPFRQVPAKPGKALHGGPFRLPSLGEKST